MNRTDEVVLAARQRIVLARFPNAQLTTSGGLCWIEDRGRKIGQIAATPMKAWSRAVDFAQAAEPRS